MMLNMFRKVSFFFFCRQVSIPTRPCFQTLSLHTHRYTHTHTHTQVHTHTDFPKTLHPSSSVTMSQHTLNIKKGLLNP